MNGKFTGRTSYSHKWERFFDDHIIPWCLLVLMTLGIAAASGGVDSILCVDGVMDGEVMKNPIEWHRECLANMQRTRDCYRKEMERAISSWFRFASDCSRYASQIDRAVANDKDGFDRELYGKVRK